MSNKEAFRESCDSCGSAATVVEGARKVCIQCSRACNSNDSVRQIDNNMKSYTIHHGTRGRSGRAHKPVESLDSDRSRHCVECLPRHTVEQTDNEHVSHGTTMPCTLRRHTQQVDDSIAGLFLPSQRCDHCCCPQNNPICKSTKPSHIWKGHNKSSRITATPTTRISTLCSAVNGMSKCVHNICCSASLLTCCW